MFADEEDRIAKLDLFQKPSDDELARLSVEELEYRIKWLEEEVERTKSHLSSKAGALSDAEAIFKK